jgi:hypothetical protein
MVMVFSKAIEREADQSDGANELAAARMHFCKATKNDGSETSKIKSLTTGFCITACAQN